MMKIIKDQTNVQTMTSNEIINLKLDATRLGLD